MMKKITKIVCCIFFIFLIASMPFSSSIVFGQELKGCDAIRLEDAETWPSVLYCSKPIEGPDPGGSAYYYFVYVNKPSDYSDFDLSGAGITGDVYFLESLHPGEDGDPPVAEFSEDNQRVEVHRSGAFILSKQVPTEPQVCCCKGGCLGDEECCSGIAECPTDYSHDCSHKENICCNPDYNPNYVGSCPPLPLPKISLTPSDQYVRINGMDECVQLVLSQIGLHTFQIREEYKKMNITDNWSGWEAGVLTALAGQLPYDYPVTYGGQTGVILSSVIDTDITNFIGSSVNERGFALLFDDIFYEGLKDLKGGIPTPKYWNYNDPSFWDALDEIQQLLDDETITKFVWGHNHPVTHGHFKSWISSGATIDDLAHPSIYWDPETGTWEGDISLHRLLQDRFGYDKVPYMAIKAYNIDNPNEYVIKFFKPRSEPIDFEEVKRHLFEGPHPVNPKKTVKWLDGKHTKYSKFFEEVKSFSPSPDTVMFLSAWPPATPIYDFSFAHVNKFFSDEVNSLMDDIIQVLDDFEAEIITKTQALDMLDDLSVGTGYVHELTTQPDLTELLPTESITNYNYMTSSDGPVKELIQVMKDQLTPGMERQVEEFQQEIGRLIGDISVRTHGEETKSLNVALRLSKKLESKGYKILESDKALLKEQTDKFNSQNRNLWEMIKNIPHDIRAGAILRWKILTEFPVELSDPIALAKEDPMYTALVAIPAFFFSFGLTFEILANNYGHYHLARLGTNIKYLGLNLLIGIGISLILNIFIQVFIFGITAQALLNVLMLTAFSFVIGIVIGIIAAIILFFLILLLEPPCELDPPWYPTQPMLKLEQHAVNANENLEYIVYGLRNCRLYPHEYATKSIYDIGLCVGEPQKGAYAGYYYFKNEIGYNSICHSDDGRCFECTIEVDPEYEGNEFNNITGAVLNRLILNIFGDWEGGNSSPQELKVCPADYVADTDSGKCVKCDSSHKEDSAEFGDTPENTCESADDLKTQNWYCCLYGSQPHYQWNLDPTCPGAIKRLAPNKCPWDLGEGDALTCEQVCQSWSDSDESEVVDGWSPNGYCLCTDTRGKRGTSCTASLECDEINPSAVFKPGWDPGDLPVCNIAEYTYFQDTCSDCSVRDKDNICRSPGSLWLGCTGTNTESCDYEFENDCNADPCCYWGICHGSTENICCPKSCANVEFFDNPDLCSSCSGCSPIPIDGCTASEQCNGIVAGTSWCEGNIMKNCDSTCTFSQWCDASCPDWNGDSDCNWLEPGSGCCSGCYYTDITGPDKTPDGKVNIRDIALAARAFGSTPGNERWEPDADINNDGEINIKDIARVARKFGKEC